MPRVYLALIHYPVVNKQGEVVASAVTNLDVHDIARALKTYGGSGFYIVTPLLDQQIIVDRIVFHWTEGNGGQRHPKRRQALALVRVVDSLVAACEAIESVEGMAPKIIATSAKSREGAVSFESLRQMMHEAPVLLVFGTAWGLSEDVISRADHLLAPIVTDTGYNHLSVRSAAAIILDRLLGHKEKMPRVEASDKLGKTISKETLTI